MFWEQFRLVQQHCFQSSSLNINAGYLIYICIFMKADMVCYLLSVSTRNLHFNQFVLNACSIVHEIVNWFYLINLSMFCCVYKLSKWLKIIIKLFYWLSTALPQKDFSNNFEYLLFFKHYFLSSYQKKKKEDHACWPAFLLVNSTKPALTIMNLFFLAGWHDQICFELWKDRLLCLKDQSVNLWNK